MRLPEPASRGNQRSAGVLVLAVTIAAMLPAVYWMARPFLAAAVLAAILAVALDPLHSRTGRLVRRPSVAALITTFAVVGPAAAAIMLGVMVVNREIRSGFLADFLRTGGRLTGTSFDLQVIQEALPELNHIAGALFTAVFAAVFLYVLLVQGKTWVAQIVALLPMDPSVTDRILATVRDAIVANVDGILAMGAVEAVLYGAIFRISGMASPAMWGAFSGLASMIPFIGAAVVWLPLTITMAVHETWIKAAMVGIVCLFTQEAVALWLVPRIVGTRSHQSPFLVALSILGATSAFGALGILVGPVIVAVFGALVQEFRIQLRLNGVLRANTRE